MAERQIAELERLVSAQPGVHSASVVPGPDGGLLVHVVPRPLTQGGQADDGYVRGWESVYDGLYGDSLGDHPDSRFAGWRSSYSGAPIPLAEMREWLAATVSTVAALHPRRVLEIGVGSGLLLSSLVTRCETYWGTDVSGAGLDWLRQAVGTAPEADRVVLRKTAAHELGGLPEACFDTVILNSVIQYFPGADYLRDVLARVFTLIAPGGSVFLGDVRNLRLHRHFRTAVELSRGRPAGQPAGRAGPLAGRVDRAVRLEKELLIDPDFFATLPGPVRADIRVKRGRWHNELNQYRYDVILRTAPGGPPPAGPPAATEWGLPVTGLDRLAEALLAAGDRGLIVTRIPNARITGGRGFSAGQPPGAADPEDLHALGERLGYRVLVTWSGADDDGRLDVLFTRCPHEVAPYRPGPAAWPLANEPARSAGNAELAGRLRRLVRRHAAAGTAPVVVVES